MTSTLDIQAAIISQLEEIEPTLFRQIEAYPLARLYDAGFANDLIKLKLPAALLILRSDSQTGRNTQRTVNWLLIIIYGGTQASSAEDCVKAVDAIRASVLNQALGDKLHLRPDSRLAMLDSGAQFTAASITLTTVEHA